MTSSLRTIGCAILAALLSACEGEPAVTPPPPVPAAILEQPNILVIVPDSLRADRVHATRDGHPVAPTIAALAARGAHFEQAVAQAGWTMPALATVLTGRYPVMPTADSTMLGWMGPGRTFPEVLTIYGYDTYAFLGTNAGRMERTVGSRFAHVVGDEAGEGVVPGRGLELADWLREERPEPWLAFVHDIDLQFVATVDQIEDPKTAQRCALLTGNRSDKQTLAIGELARCLGAGEGRGKGKEKGKVEPEDRDGPDPAIAVREAYDRVLSSYDQGLARAMAALDETGLSDRTVVVLTSPHGHHLGENGRFQHGTLNEPDLQVPLIWVDPSAPQPGLRVPQLVQQIDLAPTILARAGATPEAGTAGSSLLPLMGLEHGAYEPRAVFHINDQRNVAIREGDTKLIRFQPGGAPGRGRVGEVPPAGYLMFDLEDDPMEREDLAKGGTRGAAAELQERLDAFLEQRIAESAASLPDAASAPDPALREHLRDHGYWHHVDGGPPDKPPPQGEGAP